MIKKAKYLYYRGVIKSCNYTCSYCPFAKNKANPKEVENDQKALNQLYEILKHTDFETTPSLLMTPYGEALIYPHIQKGLAKLSQLDKLSYVGIQTNLSCNIAELIKLLKQEGANFNKIKLWCSFHPEMIAVNEFIEKIVAVSEFIEVSVGVVGNPNNIEVISLLRKSLPNSIYIWVNKMDGLKRHYSTQEIAYFKSLDPLFDMELTEPRAIPECMGGTQSFFIEANGKVYACNRNKKSMGNLYEASLEKQTCTRKICDCYLAYVNLPTLSVLNIFGETRSFRIPKKQHFKAIFFDIDGTLTNKDGVITKSVQETVRYLAQKANIYVVTALPYDKAMYRCRTIKEFISGGIFDNGMHVKDDEMNYDKRETFELETVKQLEKIKFIQTSLPLQTKSKILLKLTNEAMNQFIKIAEEMPIEINREKHCVYITPKDCNKFKQTEKLCENKGWKKEEVLVVGNSENDKALLEKFTYSVAISEANESIKKTATYCLPIQYIPMIVK